MNREYSNSEPGAPDPIVEAFRNYERAPKDVVEHDEHEPDWTPADLTAGGVTVTHMTPDGPFTEHLTTSKPIMPKGHN